MISGNSLTGTFEYFFLQRKEERKRGREEGREEGMEGRGRN
jgi:hypothetical protein